jgi:glycosyltransferase involved in cell wall biosynthesis
MRIALFSEVFLPKIDGIVTTLMRLLGHLAARGHQSLLFAPTGGPPRFARTRVVGLEGFSFPLYPELTLVSPTVDVSDALTRFRPDLVHVLGPTSLGLAGIRHASALGCPLVASYHTDLPGFAVRWGLGALRGPLRAALSWVHNHAAVTLCPSAATRDDLLSMGVRNVDIWSRGVDAHRFSPTRRSAAWRERLTGGQPKRPLLLFVGRLSPEKRVEWLRPVMDALPGACLAIVGDGPCRAELEALMAPTPTVFTGWLTGTDLAAAYASADVFVFPGANETFGNAALEAMASGLPVIAPRAGGLLDHVVDGETGVLFDPEDCGSLVMAGRWLVHDVRYRRRLSTVARTRARQRTWTATLDALLSCYERLVDRQRLARAA